MEILAAALGAAFGLLVMVLLGVFYDLFIYEPEPLNCRGLAGMVAGLGRWIERLDERVHALEERICKSSSVR